MFAERDSAASGNKFLQKLIPILTRYTSPYSQGIFGGRFRRRNVACVFAAVMLRRGCVGAAYRLAKDVSKLGAPPVPFATPFEPIPLRQDEPALCALRGDPVRQRNVARKYYDFLCETQGGPRKALALFVVIWGFLVGLVVIAIYATFQELFSGKLPEELSEFCPIAVFALGLWLWWLWRPQEWFIVPGAIVIRCSAWNSSKWELHLLRRADSVLVYWRDLRLIAIVDTAGRSFVRQATPIEAETAIRAWLSPLPPPRLEQLGDLH